MSDSNVVREGSKAKAWLWLSEDLCDAVWALIKDLVPVYTGNGQIGRPSK